MLNYVQNNDSLEKNKQTTHADGFFFDTVLEGQRIIRIDREINLEKDHVMGDNRLARNGCCPKWMRVQIVWHLFRLGEDQFHQLNHSWMMKMVHLMREMENLEEIHVHRF